MRMRETLPTVDQALLNPLNEFHPAMPETPGAAPHRRPAGYRRSPRRFPAAGPASAAFGQPRLHLAGTPHVLLGQAAIAAVDVIFDELSAPWTQVRKKCCGHEHVQCHVLATKCFSSGYPRVLQWKMATMCLCPSSSFETRTIELVTWIAILRPALFLGMRHLEAVLDLQACQNNRPFDLGYGNHTMLSRSGVWFDRLSTVSAARRFEFDTMSERLAAAIPRSSAHATLTEPPTKKSLKLGSRAKTPHFGPSLSFVSK